MCVCEREKKKGCEKQREGGGGLNWESITEVWVQQPLSVSHKHTEMCSSAGAL